MPEPVKKVTITDFYGDKTEVDVSQLQFRPSAYGIVIKDNQLLLLRQTNGYDLPGGGIELGETSEEAVIREVAEETGAAVTNPRLLTVATSFYKHLLAKNGNAYLQSLMIFYVCDYVSGELSAAGFDEGEQVYAEAPEWIPLENLEIITLGSSNDFRPYVKQILGV